MQAPSSNLTQSSSVSQIPAPGVHSAMGENPNRLAPVNIRYPTTEIGLIMPGPPTWDPFQIPTKMGPLVLTTTAIFLGDPEWQRALIPLTVGCVFDVVLVALFCGSGENHNLGDTSRKNCHSGPCWRETATSLDQCWENRSRSQHAAPNKTKHTNPQGCPELCFQPRCQFVGC